MLFIVMLRPTLLISLFLLLVLSFAGCSGPSQVSYPLVPVQNEVNTAIMRTDLGELSAVSTGQQTDVILSVQKLGEDRLLLEVVYHNRSLDAVLPYNAAEIQVTASDEQWHLRQLQVYLKEKMVMEHKSSSSVTGSVGRWFSDRYHSVFGRDYEDYESTEYYGEYEVPGYDAMPDGDPQMVDYDPNSDPYARRDAHAPAAIPRDRRPEPNDFFPPSREELEARLLDSGTILPRASAAGQVMVEYSPSHDFAYSIVIPFGYDIHQFVFVPSFEENRYYHLQRFLHPNNPPERLIPVDLQRFERKGLDRLLEGSAPPMPEGENSSVNELLGE